MRIAFLDPIPWDYRTETPYQQPLGGSQSAACYLAEALAQAGHTAFLLNNTALTDLSRGVICLPLSAGSPELLKSLALDALIVVNQPEVGQHFRRLLPDSTRLVCWIQSAADQENARSLHQREQQQAYDGFAMVSEWQRNQFHQHFGLPLNKMRVLRNAIAPTFQSLFSSEPSILAAKTQAPILAYTSTPFRGLELLLELFPRIRDAVPGTTLKVFSSMRVYQQDAAEDEFKELYDRCYALQGVDYVGSLSQSELAQALRSVTVWTYPNIFFETSCIAAMEAIASGCRVITSAIGALPETTAGFAQLIPIADAETAVAQRFVSFTPETRQAFCQQFVDATVRVLQAQATDPTAVETALQQQVDYINQNCIWSVRVHQWIEWLNSLETLELTPLNPPIKTEHPIHESFLEPIPPSPPDLPSVAQLSPSAITQLLDQAAQLGQAGQFAEVQRICQQILQQQPQTAQALHLLGLAQLQLRDTEAALTSLQQAIALAPNAAEYHGHLGVALCSCEQVEEGITAYQRALQLQPQLTDVRYNLALALHRQGNLSDAIAHYQQVVARQPQNTQALLNLGNALQQRQQYDRAIARYQQALKLRPDQAETWLRLGTAHQMQEHWEEAIRCFQRALTLNPESVETHNNLGIILYELGRAREAIAHFEQALALQPNLTHAGLNLGNTLLKLERFAEAETAYRQVLQREPDNLKALDGLVRLLRQTCQWADVEALSDRLITVAQTQLDQGKPCSVTPLNTLLLPFSAAQQQAIAQQTAQAIAQSVAERRQQLGFQFNEKPHTAHRRLRIGYVSGDFRDHAVAHLMVRLFGLHNREQFEVFAYSLGPDDGSDYRKTFEQECDRFIDISHWTPAASAQQVFQDGIDILVDLAGYTEFSSPRLFALQPAPIQVNYLGYPGTMGADFIDYVLTDRVITPPELASTMTEHCVYLPHCYQINDNQQAIPPAPSRPAIGLPETGFVYCCFNNTRKIDPHLFSVWMRILQQVPNSVMWLFHSYPTAEHNLKQTAEKQGIRGDRLIFAQRLPKAEHLNRLQLADLFLDTRFYNAHTTASDALWAGVPVLTTLGDTFAARVAASLLTAVGLPELITPSLEAYEQQAIQLAQHPQTLHALKTKLATQRLTMPLYDTERSVRAIEQAYQMMWQVYQSGESPRSLP
ncbi:tetratricopeptide repeat protein [Oscillatoria sp. FACHB-1407]|uniref:O-linked N-acetylglucosamine transferase family protein n=1 Tax=Oscillatoria sp. FACHB-1407 TaxID=2692847 RepID=UPI0016872BE0|nr:tetratricopeptide repeat protein [Oscillatoria sp. FACHB-1407]MBD2461995.1 tetratricopeptide repeat protein [Oscillatoria sp. FACHB-1407]